MEHTSHAFDVELTDITTRVMDMGTHAQVLLKDAVSALLTANKALALEVVDRDRELDFAQREVEGLSVQIIARRQPMADDLRRLVAAMRMVSDIERIGDLAKNIAKRAAAMRSPLDRSVVHTGVELLSEAAREQLAAVLNAFAADDLALAQEVRLGDERIDRLYTGLFRELLTYMMEDPRSITLCAQLLFCAKNLERVGDHATNLAETIEYAITGETPPVERPRGDTVVVEA